MNYKTMDIFTKGALWDYWKLGSDEIEPKNEEPLILRKLITIMKKKSIDADVLTNDILGFKTYEEYKDDWICEWNKDMPWVHEKPWTDDGEWKEPSIVKHYCKPFNYKLDVRSGQPATREKMDIVKEETYLEPTWLEIHSLLQEIPNTPYRQYSRSYK
ncbi:hypothetical protein Tco_0574939 [Tanacetum coccineum]